MGDFRVGLAVDKIIQEIGDSGAEGDGTYHCPDAHIGFDGLHDQVKANHAQHDTASKAQKQADGPFGIFLQHGADETAQTCAAYAGQGRGDDQGFDNAHSFFLPIFFLGL